MRLAEFIPKNCHAIVAEWEGFARTSLPAAAGMTPERHGNNASELLRARTSSSEASVGPPASLR